MDESEDKLDRIGQWLKTKLEFCANHKRINYSDKWERYDRMVKGVYSNAFDLNDKNENWRSQLYYNIMEQKRQSALSQIDAALGNGGKFPFSLSPTPDSESDEKVNAQLLKLGINLEEAIRDMQRKIDDNLLESKSLIELRKSADDASKYGAGVFLAPYVFVDLARRVKLEMLSNMPEIPHVQNEKGEFVPDPVAYKEIRDKYLEDQVIPKLSLEKIERVGFRRIKPADFFPDPSCEGDTQKGFGMFIRNHYSPATLRKMADEMIDLGDEKMQKYDRKSIGKVLKSYRDESATIASLNDTLQQNRFDLESDDLSNRGIPIYTFFGDVMRADVSDLVSGVEGEEDEDDLSQFDTMPVIIDFHRDGTIIRIIKNPHPSGLRPMHCWQWEKIDGEWVGKGIPEKLEGLQAEFNRFLRYWVDNKLLSSSVIIGVIASKLAREDGEDLAMFPGKVFFLRDGERIQDMIQQLTIVDVSGSFLEGIDKLLSLIDYESGVPRVIEGQSGIIAKTAFETQQQESHALKQLAKVVKNIDEAIVAGVEMIYQYVLVYGDQVGTKLGDFKVQATGVATFESKRMKMFEIDTLIQLAMSSPDLMVHFNIRKIIEDKVKLLGVDSDKYLKSFEEVKVAQEQQAMMAQKQQQLAMQAVAQEKMDDARAKIAVEQAKSELQSGLEAAKLKAQAQLQQEAQDHDMKKKIIDIEESKNDKD